MTPTTQGWVFLCLPAQGKSGTHGLTLASRVPFPASLHHEPLCCVRAHGMCCRMHWEGVAVTFDPEVPTPTTVIEHHLRSFRHLSEAFFAVLPCDLQLCDAEWEGSNRPSSRSRTQCMPKWSICWMHSMRCVGKYAERQWEGVVLGLMMARRLALLSTHPAVENAWVRLQAQQLLRKPPPDPSTEYGGS